MQSYQVPQFLDSGNKILGPLSIAQLIYAMVGAGISFFIFNFVTAVAPSLGILALVPASPVAAFSAYLALGQYNGRDSDVYVLKFILHTMKPRRMTYTRKPDLSEYDYQLQELTPEKILDNWNQNRLSAIGDNDFTRKDTQYKISTIRNLGSSIENLQQNLLYETYNMERKKETSESLIEQLQNAQDAYGVVIPQKPLYDDAAKFSQINRQQQEGVNFFGAGVPHRSGNLNPQTPNDISSQTISPNNVPFYKQ